MKVLNLRCVAGHGFEGWFASHEAFELQREQGLLECPLCGEHDVQQLPSAPRLNLSAARPGHGAVSVPPTDAGAQAAARPADAGAEATARQAQSMWMNAVRNLIEHTEDVGERFPEEARKIHYGEAAARGIRGQATPEQRAELQDEGIEVMALPVPAALKGPAH